MDHYGIEDNLKIFYFGTPESLGTPEMLGMPDLSQSERLGVLFIS